MPIKDRIVSWFLQNIIIPGTEIIDKPGFIILKLGKKGTEINLRELFFPESFLVELENFVAINYSKKGLEFLYRIGKKFGKEYALSSNFPSITKTSLKDVEDFIYFLVRYLEGTWATSMTYSCNLAERTIKMNLNGYVVCSKNGIGLILTDGGAAGIWEVITNDKTVEGVQIKCQGKKNNECELIVAPKDRLKNEKIDYFEFITPEIIMDFQKYNALNKIIVNKYSKYSLKQLIDAKFFEFHEGFITRFNQRYFLCEASLVYIIEDEFVNEFGSSDILFNIAFNFGKNLFESGNYSEFISNYFSALGWGDILVLEKEGKFVLQVYSYPWNFRADKHGFVIFRGLVSGLLTAVSGRIVKLVVKAREYSDSFNVAFGE